MGRSRVIVVPCGDYDEERVYRAVSEGLEGLGGIECYVKKDENILLKPNFLSPSDADKVITTHPSVIKAMCRIMAEKGYKNVKLGDSPAHGSCRTALNKLYLDESSLFGAEICAMSEEKKVDFPEGRVCRSFYFTKEAVEADAIIGLCKMKTHMLERITGAVKNMYGLIWGHRKAAGHVSYPTAVKFAKMVTDIHRATPQRLHIMDAVTAMEGNGPASGSPVHMGLILMSPDPVALDSVFCRLVDLAPQLVPTNVQGELAGIGTYRESNIDLFLADGGLIKPLKMSELVELYGKADFDVQREKEKVNPLSLLSSISGGKRRPVIDPSKCVRCGVCVEHCPVEGKAVNFKNGRQEAPVYDYRKCIRCYCCQELCPQKAISVK